MPRLATSPVPVALALLVVIAPLGVVAPPGVVAPVSHPVGTAGAAHGALAFESSFHVQQRGDVVRFDVHFAETGHEPPYSDPAYDATTANVSVRGHGYAATVEVRDDGDGHVALRFNTYAAGRGKPDETFGVATPGDRVAVRRANATDGLVPAGRYDVAASALAVPNESTEDAVATVDLRERALDDLTVLRGAPGLTDDLHAPGDVAAARREGRLARAYERPGLYTGGGERNVPVVGRGETLVLALNASGLAGALAAADGPNATTGDPNATARFESLLGRTLSLRVRHVPPPQRDGSRYRFGSFAVRRVVPDPRNDTYYLLVDPSANVTPVFGSEPVDFDDPGGVYETTVTIPRGSRLAAENRTGAVAANHTFVALRAAVAVDVPGRLLVAPDAPVSLPVTTTLRPGTDLAVRLRGATGRYVPPVRQATVGDDGRATVTVDPANLSAGEAFAVVLSRDGDVLGEFGGQVATALVEFRDREVRAGAGVVVVDAVGTTVGGFVALHRDRSGGPVVGTSAYLVPGEHVDVRVPLREGLDGTTTLVAVVHWDVDGDGEFDATDRRFGTSLPGHRTGEPAVAEAARVTVANRSTVEATPTADPTGTTPSPPATSGGRSASPSPGTAPSDAGAPVGPGFGPLVGLLALLAVALRRRRPPRRHPTSAGTNSKP